MAKTKKIFLATVQIAVDADACGNSVSGACDWFSGLLSENKDVLDWRYGTQKGVYPKPKSIGVNKDYQEGDLFL